MPDGSNRAAEFNPDMSLDRPKRLIVWRANLRIIECLQERTGIPRDRWIVNIGGIGNTAAASALMALSDLLSARAPAGGAQILLGAFGAGLTWRAAALEWGVPGENFM